MQGAYFSYMKSKGHVPDAVAAAKEQAKEAALLRLARIQNGAEPSHKNGHPKDAEKGRTAA
jgi:hypothetical protein